MSHTKTTIQNFFIDSAKNIQDETMNNNDLTDILKALNHIMEIGDKVSKNKPELGFYWNEISAESISVIYASISGHNRLALSGLRNILELSCHAFYYFDHVVELNLSINENLQADKYVSSLIRDDKFFTTAYIKTFNKKILELQGKVDSVSDFLKKEYGGLCDIVHGRHKTLFKKEALKLKYSQHEFKRFEKEYISLASVVAVMYILRFEDYSNPELNKLAMKRNIIKGL